MLCWGNNFDGQLGDEYRHARVGVNWQWNYQAEAWNNVQRGQNYDNGNGSYGEEVLGRRKNNEY